MNKIQQALVSPCNCDTLHAGFSCTMGGWNPQLDELLAEDEDGRPLTQV